MKNICKAFVLSIIGLVAFCTFAYGESTDIKASEKLDTIVVTAQKKEENIQKVPLSMDAFSQIDLEDAGIKNTPDLVRLSSNVHIKETHVEHALVIRGISSYHSSIYSPAGFYVDDISYPLHYMQNTGLLDVERIEVLKGPQGTLYGHNSESGVLNIVTRQPGNESKGKILTEYSSYNTFNTEANVSGPLIQDKLFMGGAFQYSVTDSFFENDVTGDDKVMDNDRVNGRATLRWTPSDRLDLSFIGNAMQDNGHGGGFRYISGEHATDRYRVRKDTDEYLDQDSNSQAVRIKYRGDGFNVLWATSRLDQFLDKQNDADGWAYDAYQQSNIFTMDEQMLSQEIRISSDDRGPFEWLVGLYGFTEDSSFDFQYNYESTAMNRTMKHPVTDIAAEGYAVFAQGTYTLWDKIHFTAGLRYDYQTLEGDLKDNVLGIELYDDKDYDELLPKVSISYDQSDHVMLYGSVSKGYLVGGFNWFATSGAGFNFDPEYTWNYESGIKSTWFEDRLLVNLSLFYISIIDKQVSEVDTQTLSTTISNAAEAHSCGLEFLVKATPKKGLDFFASLGINESQFDDFTSSQWNATNTELVNKNYDGNTLPYAPRVTYNAGFQYRTANNFFFRADLLGTGKFYSNAANTGKQEAYQTVNLTVGYEGEHFDVYLRARNIFDEEYCTWLMPRNDGVMGLDGEPQTIGITVAYRF